MVKETQKNTNQPPTPCGPVVRSFLVWGRSTVVEIAFSDELFVGRSRYAAEKNLKPLYTPKFAQFRANK
jgi:hypothetical protein